MNYSLFLEKGLTSNNLKTIAIIAMFLDHFVSVFVPRDSAAWLYLRIPGRVVAPIMCYLIAQGYFYTSDVKRYEKRLLLFAAISHFPYVLYFNIPWWKFTSVFWGLALGLISLDVIKKDKYPIWLKFIITSICCILAVSADWNYISIMWIIAFGIFKDDFKKQMISFTLIGLVFYIAPSIANFGWSRSYQLGILLAIPLLSMYKGVRGKESKFIKYGFYAFYPVHFILLYILKVIVIS